MVPSVFVYPHTESDVFEGEAIDDLRERLFGDLRREQVRHGSRKRGLMICIENLAHATCVDVLGGRNSGPARIIAHVVFVLEGSFVVVLRMSQQGDSMCGKERVRNVGTWPGNGALGLKYPGRLLSLGTMSDSGL